MPLKQQVLANKSVSMIRRLKWTSLIGLTDEQIKQLEADPQLEDMLKLHDYVQKIKNRHYEVKT